MALSCQNLSWPAIKTQIRTQDHFPACTVCRNGIFAARGIRGTERELWPTPGLTWDLRCNILAQSGVRLVKMISRQCWNIDLKYILLVYCAWNSQAANHGRQPVLYSRKFEPAAYTRSTDEPRRTVGVWATLTAGHLCRSQFEASDGVKRGQWYPKAVSPTVRCGRDCEPCQLEHRFSHRLVNKSIPCWPENVANVLVTRNPFAAVCTA